MIECVCIVNGVRVSVCRLCVCMHINREIIVV